MVLLMMMMLKMVTMPTASEKERLGTFGAEQLLTERCTGPILSNEPSPDVNLAFQYLFLLFLFQYQGFNHYEANVRKVPILCNEPSPDVFNISILIKFSEGF